MFMYDIVCRGVLEAEMKAESVTEILNIIKNDPKFKNAKCGIQVIADNLYNITANYCFETHIDDSDEKTAKMIAAKRFPFPCPIKSYEITETEYY